MKITDLGELSGNLLLFGGVYSNLHALNALIEWADAAQIPAQNVICTGDIVAYCANAAEAVTRVRDWGCPVLKGNCEAQLAEGADDCGCGYDDGSQCSLLSRAWYAHAVSTVGASDKDWMADLPDRMIFRHGGLTYAVIHGGASDISRFMWSTTSTKEFRQEINILQSEVGKIDRVVAGHSGIGFTASVDGKIWLNAGAIGMPAHNGQQETSFVTVDSKGINNNYLNYDALAQAKEMQRVGLVQGYDQALLSGYWPSEDNLPVELRVQQTG